MSIERESVGGKLDRKSIGEKFARDGFAHIPQVLTAEELQQYGRALDEAVAKRKRNDTRRLEEKSAYEQSFIQCQYLWEDFPAVRGLTFHQKIGELAATLIGAKSVRLWHDQALYKEAGGRATEAHQDHPYWPIAERDTLTVWIPLGDVDERTGCMGYVPGSHRDAGEFIDIFSKPGDGKRLEEKYAATPPVFVHCKAGDVIFHHGYTVHMAKPNNSDRTRRVYTMIYLRDGCTRAGDRAHPSVDRCGVRVGEKIDSAATPIVWPLPQGGFPRPAPWPMDDRRQRYSHLGVIPGNA